MVQNLNLFEHAAVGACFRESVNSGARVLIIHRERDTQGKHSRETRRIHVKVERGHDDAAGLDADLNPLAIEADGREITAEEVHTGNDQTSGKPRIRPAQEAADEQPATIPDSHLFRGWNAKPGDAEVFHGRSWDLLLDDGCTQRWARPPQNASVLFFDGWQRKDVQATC